MRGCTAVLHSPASRTLPTRSLILFWYRGCVCLALVAIGIVNSGCVISINLGGCQPCAPACSKPCEPACPPACGEPVAAAPPAQPWDIACEDEEQFDCGPTFPGSERCELCVGNNNTEACNIETGPSEPCFEYAEPRCANRWEACVDLTCCACTKCATSVYNGCCYMWSPIGCRLEPLVHWPGSRCCRVVNFGASECFVGPPDTVGPGHFHPVPTHPVFDPVPLSPFVDMPTKP